MPSRFKCSFAAVVALVFLSCVVSLARQAAQLELAVDHTMIHAGERVRLSITPAELASQYSFAVGFQDGPIDVLPEGQTEIQHEYRTPGRYRISIASQTPIPEVTNNGIAVDVDSIPLTVQPQTLSVGDSVTFTIDFNSPPSESTRYRFIFGDGSSTGWRDVPTVTYSYAQPDTYMIRGEVLRKEWTQPLATSYAAVTVGKAPTVTEVALRVVNTSSALRPWILVLAGIVGGALLVTTGYKTYHWYFPPKLSYERHRGGLGAGFDEGAPPEVLLELVLHSGIASGKHAVSTMEVKRGRVGKRKHG